MLRLIREILFFGIGPIVVAGIVVCIWQFDYGPSYDNVVQLPASGAIEVEGFTPPVEAKTLNVTQEEFSQLKGGETYLVTRSLIAKSNRVYHENIQLDFFNVDNDTVRTTSVIVGEGRQGLVGRFTGEGEIVGNELIVHYSWHERAGYITVFLGFLLAGLVLAAPFFRLFRWSERRQGAD
jgi:hypothetical protein